MGMLSMNASEIVVRRFIAPGPLVAMHTPTLPVERAYPWAIKPPPCSCLGRITRIFFERVKALWRSIEEPPGYAKTMSTPSFSRQRTTTSAPFIAAGLTVFFDVFVLTFIYRLCLF